MARKKSTKHPETKKPPDKTKKKKKSMDKDIRPKKEQQQERPVTIKRKGERGVSSPSKKLKRNQRDDEYDDEDWMPSDDSSSQETLEDDDKILSSKKEKSPKTSKRKSTEAFSKSNKKLKGSAIVTEEDDANLTKTPDVNEGSSESHEDRQEPKPQEQLLRGTRYIKINGNTWKIILVRGDGNCFFYTLAHLLGRSLKDHRQIRADIVHAAKNFFWGEIRDDVKRMYFSGPEFQGKTEEELKQLYYNIMFRPGVYASEIEIKVASMLYPFKICYVQQYVPPNPHDYRVCDVLPLSNKPIKWIRFSSGKNYEQGHFEPLEPVGDIQPLSDGGYDDDLRKIDTKKESNNESTSSKGASDLSLKPEYASTTTQPNSSHKCSECDVKYEDAMAYYTHCLKKHPNQVEVKGNSKAGRCPICEQIIVRKRNVPRHIQDVHSNPISKQFKCPTCEKCFTRKENLVQHQRTHSELQDRPYACKECGKTFTKKYNLGVHLKTQHLNNHSNVIERPYACKECEKSFKTKGNLTAHLKTHSKIVIKPWACEECGKSFTKKSNLTLHQVKHTGNRPFSCELCSKDFKTMKGLNEHSISHSDKRPYQCKICSKDFKTMKELNQHSVTHSDERPFKCKICSKGFKFKQHLVEHERTHYNDNPFKCGKCEKSFPNTRNLRQHQFRHSEERPFKCSICSKSFKQKKTLQVHQRLPCGQTYPCPHCVNVRFENRGNLTRHLTIHQPKTCICSTCGKACRNKYRLVLHEKVHDKNRRTYYPFPCRYCSLRCQTSDQRELHTFLHHSDAYTKEQQAIKTAGHQVVGPTAHKYVLYTVLLVEAKKFPGGTGNDVWAKLCDNPGKYDVQFYTGVYSSLSKVSVRPGHMQPASMRASAVYQQHRKGWRCLGATVKMANYVEMRRREAIYIEWAKSINSKSQVCINKKTEPLPKREHRHITSMVQSGLNYFCFDKNHCSGSDRAHAIPNTDIPLGLHLHGRLHEMYFRGCGCDTCKYLSKQRNIDDYFEVDSDNNNLHIQTDRDNQTQDQVSEDAEEDIENSVGVLYETALDPEAFEDEESEEDENLGEGETDEDEQEIET